MNTLWVFLLLLTACEYTEVVYPERTYRNNPPIFRAPGEVVKQNSIFGDDGLILFGSGSKPKKQTDTVEINSFLWRASLDTIAFMPINSVDPFGGTIITDWYVPPQTPNERFKVNIYILSRDLRSDGLKAVVFRQICTPNGTWKEAPIHVNAELENTILNRARKIRISYQK